MPVNGWDEVDRHALNHVCDQGELTNHSTVDYRLT